MLINDLAAKLRRAMRRAAEARQAQRLAKLRALQRRVAKAAPHAVVHHSAADVALATTRRAKRALLAG